MRLHFAVLDLLETEAHGSALNSGESIQRQAVDLEAARSKVPT